MPNLEDFWKNNSSSSSKKKKKKDNSSLDEFMPEEGQKPLSSFAPDKDSGKTVELDFEDFKQDITKEDKKEKKKDKKSPLSDFDFDIPFERPKSTRSAGTGEDETLDEVRQNLGPAKEDPMGDQSLIGDVGEGVYLGIENFFTNSVPRAEATVGRMIGEAKAPTPEEIGNDLLDVVQIDQKEPSLFAVPKAAWETGWDIADIFSDTARIITDAAIPDDTQQNIEEYSEEALKGLNIELQEKMEEEGIGQDVPWYNPKKFSYQVGSGGASLLAALGTTALTRSPSVGASFLSSIEGSTQYNEARKSGQNPGDALTTALVSSYGIYKLEKFGLENLVRGFGGNKLLSAAAKTGIETLQETSQEFWQNLVAKTQYDPEQELTENLIPVSATMLPVAGMGSMVGSATQRRFEAPTKLEQEKEDKDKGQQGLNFDNLPPGFLGGGITRLQNPQTEREKQMAEIAKNQIADNLTNKMNINKDEARTVVESISDELQRRYDKAEEGVNNIGKKVEEERPSVPQQIANIQNRLQQGQSREQIALDISQNENAKTEEILETTDRVQQVQERLQQGYNVEEVTQEFTKEDEGYNDTRQFVVNIAQGIKDQLPDRGKSVQTETEEGTQQEQTTGGQEAMEEAQQEFEDIGDTLDQTTQQIQERFDQAEQGQQEKIRNLNEETQQLQQQLDQAPDRSQQKKDLKQKLADKKKELQEAEQDDSPLIEQSERVRETVNNYITEEVNVNFTDDQSRAVVDNVMQRLDANIEAVQDPNITTAEVERIQNQTLRNIIDETVQEASELSGKGDNQTTEEIISDLIEKFEETDDMGSRETITNEIENYDKDIARLLNTGKIEEAKKALKKQEQEGKEQQEEETKEKKQTKKKQKKGKQEKKEKKSTQQEQTQKEQKEQEQQGEIKGLSEKDIKNGAKVVFHKIEKGEIVGLEDKIYTINSSIKDSGKTRVELIDDNGNTLWTTPESISFAPTQDTSVDKDYTHQPITQVQDHKIKSPTEKTVYKKGEGQKVFKGEYNGTPLTTNAYLFEFRDVALNIATMDFDKNDLLESLVQDGKNIDVDKTVGPPVAYDPKQGFFELPTGDTSVLVDAEYYNYLAKQYSEGTEWVSEGNNNPLFIRKAGEIKAMLSPMNKDYKEPKNLISLDAQAQKRDNKGYGKQDYKNRRGGTGQTGVSKTVQDSTKESGRTGKTTQESGQGTTRTQRQRKSEYDRTTTRERSATRLTNEEIDQRVSDITSIDQNGEVQLTGEVTNDIKEAANAYKPGGESKESGRGILDEYYTNSQIVDIVKSLLNFQQNSLKILEPAVGTGNFLYALPEMTNNQVEAHELNPTTAKITKIFHPDASVTTNSFESRFIDNTGNKKSFEADYDLVIGNPPYGEHRGESLGLGEEKSLKKYEDYFIKRGLDVLNNGGKMAMVVPSGFLNRSATKPKKTIAAQGEIVNAFRLPQGVFAGTDIGTDIVILEKQETSDSQTIESRVNQMSNDQFFETYPDNILGTPTTQKTRWGKTETVIQGTLDDAVNYFYNNSNHKRAVDVLKRAGVKPTQENVETAEETTEDTSNTDLAKKTNRKRVKQNTTQRTQAPSQPAGKKKSAKNLTPLSEQFKDVSEGELELWRKTKRDGSVEPTNQELQDHSDKLNKYNGKWYLDFNYLQGDIYQKLDQLEQEDISKEQRAKQKEKLEALIPKKEKVSDMMLTPNVGFVRDTEIGGEKLQQKFINWTEDLPRDVFKPSNRREVEDYTRNEQVRGNDKEMNERIRSRRKEVADRVFKKFLQEGLTKQEQQELEDKYNRTFNFFYTPDYSKVPMFSRVSKTFKGDTLELREVQKQGIGRLVNKGVGLLAHDVGLGKTLSAVLAVNEKLERGWVNKPVVIVPSENVYRQWVETINDVMPHRKVNKLGNLGKGAPDLSQMEIEDGSISIMTYEGFKRLGFKEDTYDHYTNKFSYIADELKKNKSKREQAKQEEKGKETKGIFKKGAKGGLYFEDLGFDDLTFDEVHNANKIVSKVKLDKGQASEFNRFSLSPSDLGIKTWLASQYIQENYGKNISLLSATPFTNHPLEYYSILSLMADETLTKMGFQNVNDFFGTFMEASDEYEFKADGTYKKKTDIRSFKNYRQFRKLLDSYIDFRDGEEEGVHRPNRVQETYEIPQNEFGRQMEENAQKLFEKESEPGNVLKAIGELRKIAFSPYLAENAPNINPSEYKTFVENSPKLKTLMGLIGQNKKDNPEAGQVIYSDDVGKDTLPIMRDYLINEMGYKKSEVDIISGGVSKAKRLQIQDKYNNGEIKVLLGSSAIKEGVDLQYNTSDLYILSLPWNFTQLKQVIGRVWRHGNKWKNVRINNLFIQDSVDVFFSQKLDNKQKRYEKSIQSGEQEVDVGDIAYEEMKFDLIKDPERRADLEIQAEKERLQTEIDQAEAELAFSTRKLEDINKIDEQIKRKQEFLEREKQEQKEAAQKGEEFDDYWIDKTSKDIQKLKNDRQKVLEKLQEKEIDVEELLRRKEQGEKEIQEKKDKIEELENNRDQRVKEIKEKMPERPDLSDNIVQQLVQDRQEKNKDFYQKEQATEETTLAPEKKTKKKKTATGKTTQRKQTKVTRKKKTPTKDEKEVNIITDPNLSEQEKIGRLLDVKQAGKDYKDVGERVAGSKKERATVQKMIEYGDQDLVKALSETLGSEVLSQQLDKNKILENHEVPKPDSERAKGTPAAVAGFKVRTYNAIRKNPQMVRDSKKKYGFSERLVSPEIQDSFMSVYPNLLRNFVEDLNNIEGFEGLRAFKDKWRYLTDVKKPDSGKTRTETQEAIERLDKRIESKQAQIETVEEKHPQVETRPEIHEREKQELKELKEKKKELEEEGLKERVELNVLGDKVEDERSSLGGRSGILGTYEEMQQAQEAAHNNGVVQVTNADGNKEWKFLVQQLPGLWRTFGGEKTKEEALNKFKERVEEQKESPTQLLKKAQEDTKSRIEDLTTNYNRFLPKQGAKNTQQQIQEQEQRIQKLQEKKENIRNTQHGSEFIEKRTREIDNEIEAVQSYLNRLKGEEENYRHGNFKPLERVKRSGKEIPDSQTTAENLKKMYGFKSVQYGNYMDDATAKEHTKHTMGALEDMSQLLGVDMPRLMNTNGLSIAFGARGGGGFNAHYEPTQNIINLTKNKGDGSFGHELMHFLDYKLGNETYRGRWSKKPKGRGRYYRSVETDKISMNITNALINGVAIPQQVVFKPQQQVNEEDVMVQRAMEKKEKGLSLEQALEESGIRPRERAGGRAVPATNAAYQAFADVYRQNVEANIPQISNNFYQQSFKFGGNKDSYWTRPQELWARAFQSYLEDKMEEKGITNNYLTRSTKNLPFYPQGEERQQLNKMFDELFEQVKKDYPLKGKAGEQVRFRLKDYFRRGGKEEETGIEPQTQEEIEFGGEKSEESQEEVRSRFPDVNTLLREIDRTRWGRQGLQVNSAEFKQIMELLSKNANKENRETQGLIYIPYGARKDPDVMVGEKDIVLGRIGHTKIVAEVENGKLNGWIRTHMTQINDNEIVGRINPGNLLEGGTEQQPRFRMTQGFTTSEIAGEGEQTLTTAGEYLQDLKQRLNIDFDVHFVDNILAAYKSNPFQRAFDKAEAEGATADNTIVLARELSKYTAEHESVHLTLANMDKIPVFRRNGLTRDKVLQAKAEQLGMKKEGNEARLEEEVAYDFEKYLEEKQETEPKGILRKFFALLKKQMMKFARLVGNTRGDVLKDYYDILSEGEETQSEMARLENQGILTSFIKEGALSVVDMERYLRKTTNPMEAEKAERIAQQVENATNSTEKYKAIANLSDQELRALHMTPQGDRVHQQLEEEYAQLIDYARGVMGAEDLKFRLKEEGDKRMKDLKNEYNKLAQKQEALERDLQAWELDFQRKMNSKQELEQVLEGTPEEVKQVKRYTKRTAPVGELTPKGEEMVKRLEFNNIEEARNQVHEFLKRKADLIENKNRMRELRGEIQNTKREKGETKQQLKEVGRKMKQRQQVLNRKEFYTEQGRKRGRKDAIKLVSRRRRVIRNIQDAAGLSDTRAKQLLGNVNMHLMSERGFSEAMRDFAARAFEKGDTIDAQKELQSVIQEKQLDKHDNLRQALGYPSITQMTEEQAQEFISILSQYEFGDVFLSQRLLETIHRTNWGDIKTYRELYQKIEQEAGLPTDRLKDLTAPDAAHWKNWLRLSREHPFYNWLVSKRMEAKLKEEKEIYPIEMEINQLANRARRSRRKKMKIGERVKEWIVPTDEYVFEYMESENKDAYAKEKGMTQEEIEFANALIKKFYSAYEYLSSEYGMQGRKNYMVHARRSMLEALKEEKSIKKAFQEVFTAQREEQAVFKILDDKTGEVLAFEKFFANALKRSGAMVPSKNVASSSLAYFRAFSRKKALDEFIPQAMAMVKAQQAIQGTTQKGLAQDPTVENFIKEYINDAKGRKVSFITKQGSKWDIALRAGISWVAFKYLAYRLVVATASFVGDFMAIAKETTWAEKTRGIIRSFNLPNAHQVNKQFRFFTGRNPITEMFDPQYSLPSTFKQSLLVLLSLSNFQANKFFLRAKMTKEEWKNQQMSNERMLEVAQMLSRAKPNHFYIKSLNGNTTAGSGIFQFGSWAAAITNTTVSDAEQVVKKFRNKGAKEAITSEEAIALGRFATMAGLALTAVSLAHVDEDDDSTYAQVMRRALKELTTLTQAMQFIMDPRNYALIIDEMGKWFKLVELMITQEEYETEGKGYGVGDPKWKNQMYRVMTPTLLRDYFERERVDTAEREVDKAIRTGNFEPKKIAEQIAGDNWQEKDEDYRQDKIAEVKKLYRIKKKYGDDEVVNRIMEGGTNTETVESILDYTKEQNNKDEVLDKMKKLKNDKQLCKDTERGTGCLVSGQLYKEFKIKAQKTSGPDHTFDSEPLRIIMEGNNNDERVKELVKYSNKVGRQQVLRELKQLQRNKKLYTDPQEMTGGPVSDQLYKKFILESRK